MAGRRRGRKILPGRLRNQGAQDISALPRAWHFGGVCEPKPCPNKFFHAGAVSGDDSRLTNPPKLTMKHPGLARSLWYNNLQTICYSLATFLSN